VFGGNDLASRATDLAHLLKKLSLKTKIPGAGGRPGIFAGYLFGVVI